MAPVSYHCAQKCYSVLDRHSDKIYVLHKYFLLSLVKKQIAKGAEDENGEHAASFFLNILINTWMGVVIIF